MLKIFAVQLKCGKNIIKRMITYGSFFKMILKSIQRMIWDLLRIIIYENCKFLQKQGIWIEKSKIIIAESLFNALQKEELT